VATHQKTTTYFLDFPDRYLESCCWHQPWGISPQV
jgi:hypothetical protein